jgi:hypothetical protein
VTSPREAYQTGQTDLQELEAVDTSLSLPQPTAPWKDSMKVGSLVLAKPDGYLHRHYGIIISVGPPPVYDGSWLGLYRDKPYMVEFFHPDPKWRLTQRCGPNDLYKPYSAEPPPPYFTSEEIKCWQKDEGALPIKQ